MFAVLILYVGLVLFSSMLGSITALLNQSRKEAYSRLRQGDNLRRFLAENKVSLQLSNQIMYFLRGNRGKTVRILESEVESLKHLPMSLQLEMRYEVYGHHFTSPVFVWLRDAHQPAAIDICSMAVSEVVLKKAAEPFNFRMRGLAVHFVANGSLDYYPGLASLFGSSGDVLSVRVSSGACLAEAVLWFHWEHKGLLRVVANSAVVIKVSADGFRLAVQQQDSSLQDLKVYVKLVAARLQQALSDGEDIDDTYRPFENIKDLMESLALESDIVTDAQPDMPTDTKWTPTSPKSWSWMASKVSKVTPFSNSLD
mmetsp:Transcript_84502/g.272384  ORF Transcript_84502/g.272384 Transcript_84502/m.272384 type:complete len:312 (-) Transcript_84502:211-1146(-)